MIVGERWRELAAKHGLDNETVDRKAKAAYSWRGAVPVWENVSEEVKDFMKLQSLIAITTP